MPREKSVALVSDSMLGGLGRAVESEASWLLQQGFAVHLMAPGLPDDHRLPGTVTFHELVTPDAAANLAEMARATVRLRSMLKTIDPTLVHCHGMRSYILALPNRHRHPVAVTYHGGPLPSGIKSATFRVLAKSSIRAWAASPGMPHPFEFALQRSPLTLVDGPHQYGRDMDSPLRVAWFGRLDPPKRPDLWVRALSECTQSGLRIEAHLIGDGVLKASTTELAANEGLTLIAHGPMPPEEAMSHMDVLLQWSDSEAVPFTVQEAIWYGRVALANSLPGTEFLLGECATGIVTSNTVVSAVRSLMDPEKYRWAAQEQSRILFIRYSTNDSWGALSRLLTELGVPPSNESR